MDTRQTHTSRSKEVDTALNEGLGETFRRGMHRVIDPATTVRCVQPLMRTVGITRISNLTGLDTVGLPVVSVCRPNSRSNVVFQGKGLDLDAAKASGLMEAMETYYAERILQPMLFASAAEMRAHHLLADLSGLPRITGSRFTEDTRILWIEGRDLLHHCGVWVPYELVHANFTFPQPPGSGSFLASTNGLASGNTPEEAVSHGICEIVERDAATLFSICPDGIEERRLDPDSIDDADCLSVLGKFREAGLAVAIWDITSDIGVAAFHCHVIESSCGPGSLPLPAEGDGCHPDRSIAFLRALAEAGQSRVTVISGTRDDIGPSMYGRSDDPDTLRRWRSVIGSALSAQSFGNVPDRKSGSPKGDVEYELSRLHSAGIDQVIVLDLSASADVPFSVVRVIIPRLEGPRHSTYVPGPRARALREQLQ